MKAATAFELPGDLQQVLKKAKRLEWITIIYLVSVVFLMYLVMGSSQAMKTAWFEDALSMLPAIAFLVASAVYDRKPNVNFPYGYHRAFGIAFLAGSLALFAIGAFLIIDSSMALIHGEHPTIGSREFFGHQIWMGWVMILALCYSAVPAMILGFKKQPLAKKIHNKILYTDADTQRADYMTAIAAMGGIVGVGLGLWWADAVAALFISFSVLKDGASNLKRATKELMDRRPTQTDSEKKDVLPDEIDNLVRSWPWVHEVQSRFRESGQVYIGEVLVIPHSEEGLVEKVEEGLKALHEYHWKIHDVVIVPVRTLPGEYDAPS